MCSWSRRGGFLQGQVELGAGADFPDGGAHGRAAASGRASEGRGARGGERGAGDWTRVTTVEVEPLC